MTNAVSRTGIGKGLGFGAENIKKSEKKLDRVGCVGIIDLYRVSGVVCCWGGVSIL